MIKVLFVCLGNICRSPLAEGIFKDLVKKKGLSDKIFCDSAGTANYHIGKDPDHRSCDVASRYKITLEHKARQFFENDFEDFDYIVAMDRSNFENIKRLKAQGSIEGKVFLMRKFDPLKDKEEDVPDPYYGGLSGFEEVYKMLLRSCENLLEYLLNEHQIND